MEDPINNQNNDTLVDSSKNATAKIPASPEGMALAYGSLVIMALLPIYFGSFRSVLHHMKQKASGEKIETVSTKDAAMFPLIASTALLTLYIVFTNFSADLINVILSSYFFFLGTFALTHVVSPTISNLIPSSVPSLNYQLLFTREKQSNEKETLIDVQCSTYDFIAMGICSLFGLWYMVKKHWVANNLLGLAFAVNGVELLHLNSFQTGVMLLGGLFLYDIFWVFGTNVMVTVAKKFDAPIKLIFPQDILSKGLTADNFAMLGLGDIVIPGIFIALLMRFDKSLNRGSNTYFNVTFFAYICGLLLTIFVMQVFKHAQPALLYLVPACVAAPSLVAYVKGDFPALLKYEDEPSEANGDEGEKKEN